MDESSMQIHGGVGSVKKSKSRRKQRSKKQVTKKGEAESRSQMNDNSEANDDSRDCEEMGILETDLTMKLQSENRTLCADSTGNLYTGNGSRRKKKQNKRAKAKDEVQSLSQGKMDAVLMEIQTGEIIVDPQSFVQTEMDEIEVENECIRKAGIEKAQSMGDQKMLELRENVTEGDVTTERKRKKKKKKKRKAKIRVEAEGINPIEMEEGSTENLNEQANGKKGGEDEDIKQATIGEEHNLDAEVTEILVERDVMVKSLRRKKKKKKKRKAKGNKAAESLNLIDMVEGSTEEHTEGIANDKGEGESGIIERVASIGDESQNLAKHKVVTEVATSLAEGDLVVKTRKKRKKKKKIMEKIEDGAESINQFEVDNEATKYLTEVITTNKGERKGKRKRRNATAKVQIMSQPEMKIDLVENLSDGNATGNLNQQSSTKTTVEDAVKDIYQNKMAKKRRKHKKARIYEVQNMNEHESVPKFHLPGAEHLCLEKIPITSIRKKLLVLDVNGLLADVIMPAPKHCKGEWDIRISGRAIFRRPWCNDFLKFCFNIFEVGIWSSRSRQIIDKIVNYLLGDLQEKLLFCWDMSHCTQTGFRTLENYHKPLVCKELRKIWENDDPNSRWKKGDFDESNTLLVDDSPYKALLNPLNTAIFPPSYHYTDKNKDTSLGPKGDIRVYLEELAKCENVQKYVEQHPFGGKAIDEQNLSWGFYSKVVDRMSMQMPS